MSCAGLCRQLIQISRWNVSLTVDMASAVPVDVRPVPVCVKLGTNRSVCQETYLITRSALLLELGRELRDLRKGAMCNRFNTFRRGPLYLRNKTSVATTWSSCDLQSTLASRPTVCLLTWSHWHKVTIAQVKSRWAMIRSL